MVSIVARDQDTIGSNGTHFVTVLASNGNKYLVNFCEAYLCPDGSTADAESLITDDFKSISAAYYDTPVDNGNWVLLDVLKSAGVTYDNAMVADDVYDPNANFFLPTYACVDGALQVSNGDNVVGYVYCDNAFGDGRVGFVDCDGGITDASLEEWFECMPLRMLAQDEDVNDTRKAYNTLVLILQGRIDYDF